MSNCVCQGIVTQHESNKPLSQLKTLGCGVHSQGAWYE